MVVDDDDPYALRDRGRDSVDSRRRSAANRAATRPRSPRRVRTRSRRCRRPPPSDRRSRRGCRGARSARCPDRSRALVAHEDLDAGAGSSSAKTTTGAPPAWRAALRSASRAAATSASPAGSSARSPIAVISTVIACSSSTSATTSRSAATSVSLSSSVSPAIQARSACSWRRARRATAAGSWAWRWTSASVCRTESCRCAAKRWRSSSRASWPARDRRASARRSAAACR